MFHSLSLADGPRIRCMVNPSASRNCDLNFMNMFSWQFLYATELAAYDEGVIIRFQTHGHLAYLPPLGYSDWGKPLQAMMDDAAALGHPFLMLGVLEDDLERLERCMPGHFHARAERDYADYLYEREALCTLSGKKLQGKRNHVHRFERSYPDFCLIPLDKDHFDACLSLAQKWYDHRENELQTDSFRELQSMQNTFAHWEHLGGSGLILQVRGETVAFTYGAPINFDTFDVCVEKADRDYEGAYSFINRSFVTTLPKQYAWINREEDLGIPGLRKAKLSYHPHRLLQKYRVMTRNPFAG